MNIYVNLAMWHGFQHNRHHTKKRAQDPHRNEVQKLQYKHTCCIPHSRSYDVVWQCIYAMCVEIFQGQQVKRQHQRYIERVNLCVECV